MAALIRLLTLMKPSAFNPVIGAKASSSGEALKQLDEAEPDVVLLGIDLDRENGINLIPSLTIHPGTKVLVMTGSRETILQDAAMLAGGGGVVQKGDATEIILKAILKIHQGEIWLDRSSINRISHEFSRKQSPSSNDLEQAKIDSLTVREREIVIEIASNSESRCKLMAEKLHISEHTFRNHLASIYEKLGLSIRLQLFAYASKHQLGKI